MDKENDSYKNLLPNLQNLDNMDQYFQPIDGFDSKPPIIHSFEDDRWNSYPFDKKYMDDTINSDFTDSVNSDLQFKHSKYMEKLHKMRDITNLKMAGKSIKHIDHNTKERFRRVRLNLVIEDLKMLIPGIEKKMDRTDILETAVNYIKTMNHYVPDEKKYVIHYLYLHGKLLDSFIVIFNINKYLSWLYVVFYQHDNNEEDNLINEINFIFRKTIYQSNHWDDAIIDYRETERPNFRQDANNDIVCQMKKKIEKNIKRVINFNEFFHIIDISKSGFIKPHVDSIRFCGQVISVLSLCSDSILRLRNTKDQSDYNDFMLKRKSLYILKFFWLFSI
ncbi:Alkylated DNA repair protein alkB [Intoshia linei]|uniref:Alkylated DNA repair protein alkB n=1 Tax=Intoshia linei TaxID=1819745 RepID=A0A177AVH6_9BILA|nr:Alkylated DNA repair protein alkB [Intoshia linei]